MLPPGASTQFFTGIGTCSDMQEVGFVLLTACDGSENYHKLLLSMFDELFILPNHLMLYVADLFDGFVELKIGRRCMLKSLRNFRLS